jgi:hypothetical protein
MYKEWLRLRISSLAYLSLVLGLEFFVAPVAADTFGSGASSFEIEFVTIGNPGNPPDANPNPAGAVRLTQDPMP